MAQEGISPSFFLRRDRMGEKTANNLWEEGGILR
jgi:hypothetical protein